MSIYNENCAKSSKNAPIVVLSTAKRTMNAMGGMGTAVEKLFAAPAINGIQRKFNVSSNHSNCGLQKHTALLPTTLRALKTDLLAQQNATRKFFNMCQISFRHFSHAPIALMTTHGQIRILIVQSADRIELSLGRHLNFNKLRFINISLRPIRLRLLLNF